jgi:transcriptional regulator with XRE-family HTH domain
MNVSTEHSDKDALRKAIGLRMRSERERLGFTQVSLSEKLGVIRLTVVKYEGGITCPGVDQIHLLQALGFDTDFVVDGYYSLQSEGGRKKFAAVLAWVQREASIAGKELTITQQVDLAWALFDQFRRSAQEHDLDASEIEKAVQSALVNCVDDR